MKSEVKRLGQYITLIKYTESTDELKFVLSDKELCDSRQ